MPHPVYDHPGYRDLSAQIADLTARRSALGREVAQHHLPGPITADAIRQGKAPYELAALSGREEEWRAAQRELEAAYPSLHVELDFPDRNIGRTRFLLGYVREHDLNAQIAGGARWWNELPAGERALQIYGGGTLVETPDGVQYRGKRAFPTIQAALREILAERRRAVEWEDDED